MSSYPLVPLREVLEEEADEVAVEPLASYRISGVLSFGKGLFLRSEIAGSETKYKTLRRLHAGRFVMSRLKAFEGAVAVVRDEFEGTMVSAEFPTFRIREERADPRYIDFVCRWPHFWERLRGRSKGVGARRERVHTEDLLSIEVPLPDLDEQNRLVAKLHVLRQQVERTRDLRGQANTWLQAMLPAAVEARLRPRRGWKRATILELCEAPRYGYTSAAAWEPVGPKFVRISDISQGSIQWDEVPFCECPTPDPYLLAPGDLLVARTGRPGGSVLIEQCPEAVFASYLIRLRVREGVSPEYLYWYFQSPSYWAQIRAGSRGTAHMNVNAKLLQRIVVPVAPEEEQERAVVQLAQTNQRIRAFAAQTARSKSLGDSLSIALLDHAFAGAV